MSAHVLLNLLNESGKRDKMQGLHNKFNKFINTGARMLDSIYHMTLKLFFKPCFCVKNAKILSYTRRYYGLHYLALPKSVNH